MKFWFFLSALILSSCRFQSMEIYPPIKSSIKDDFIYIKIKTDFDAKKTLDKIAFSRKENSYEYLAAPGIQIRISKFKPESYMDCTRVYSVVKSDGKSLVFRVDKDSLKEFGNEFYVMIVNVRGMVIIHYSNPIFLKLNSDK